MNEKFWDKDEKLLNATNYFLIAEYLAFNKSLVRAKQLYEAAYNLDKNAFLATKLVSVGISLGRDDEALLNARQMVLQYPKSAELKILLGRLLAQSQPDEAIAVTKAALQINPTSETAYEQLVSIYQSQQQTDQSIALLRDMTKKLPGSVIGWAFLSRLLVSKHQWNEAMRAAQRAYALRSSNAELALVYAYTMDKTNQKSAQKIYELFFTKNPTLDDLVGRTVLLYRVFGDVPTILKLIDRLSTPPSKMTRSLQHQKIFVLWELNREQEALALIQSLLLNEPASEQLTYLLALGYGRLNQIDESVAIYRKIPADSPYYPLAELNIVRLLATAHRDDEALEALDQAVKESNTNEELLFLGASIHASKKNFDKAAELMDTGFGRFSSNLKFLFLRGVYEERSGNVQDCIATMKRVIHEDPSHTSALNYLGYLYADRGENLDVAEQLVSRALELKPDDGYYLDSLGWVYFKKRDYDRAMEYLQRATQVSPNEGVILEHLGDVLLATGKKKEALEAYQKALQAKLEDDDKPRIEAKAKQILAEIPLEPDA